MPILKPLFFFHNRNTFYDYIINYQILNLIIFLNISAKYLLFFFQLSFHIYNLHKIKLYRIPLWLIISIFSDFIYLPQ